MGQEVLHFRQTEFVLYREIDWRTPCPSNVVRVCANMFTFAEMSMPFGYPKLVYYYDLILIAYGIFSNREGYEAISYV